MSNKMRKNIMISHQEHNMQLHFETECV